MADYMRSLLTELFKPFEESVKKFSDDDVCKNFLVAFCPNELFHNTKAELGVCHKLHDLSLQRQYQESADKDQHDYEVNFYMTLQRLCDELDRRIKSGKARLAMTPVSNLAQPEQDLRDERKIMLENQIKELLSKVEAAGEEGRVEEAAEVMRTVDAIKAELRILVNNEDINPTMRQEKQLEVCEVCGAFIATNDAPERLAAHMSGKQHTGYLKIRERLSLWKAKGGKFRDERSDHHNHHHHHHNHHNHHGGSRGRNREEPPPPPLPPPPPRRRSRSPPIVERRRRRDSSSSEDGGKRGKFDKRTRDDRRRRSRSRSLTRRPNSPPPPPPTLPPPPPPPPRGGDSPSRKSSPAPRRRSSSPSTSRDGSSRYPKSSRDSRHTQQRSSMRDYYRSGGERDRGSRDYERERPRSRERQDYYSKREDYANDTTERGGGGRRSDDIRRPRYQHHSRNSQDGWGYRGVDNRRGKRDLDRPGDEEEEEGGDDFEKELQRLGPSGSKHLNY